MEPPQDAAPPTAEQFAALTRRVYTLERELAYVLDRAPASTRQREVVDAVPPERAPQPLMRHESEQAAFVPLPSFEPESAYEPSDLSLEARVGAHWFSRVGIAALLLGAAWLLKWAIDNNWISPAVRVWLGLLCGLGGIAWGESFWRRKFAVSAYAMIGLGNGLLYLSLWASFALYHLVPSWVAFVPMLGITAWNGWRSDQNDERLFAVYALLLGFSIPLLLGNGENREIQLFLFLFALDAAVVVLAVRKPWRFLLPTAAVVTALMAWGWAAAFYAPELVRSTVGFLAIFLMLFLGACMCVALRHRHNEVGESAAGLGAAVVAAAAVSLLFALDYRGLLDARAPALLVLAGISLLVFLLMPHRDAETVHAFRMLQYAAVLALLTSAVWLHFDGRRLMVAWALEGLVLAAVAVRWPRLEATRWFSIGTLGLSWLGALALIGNWGPHPLRSRAMATFACVLAAMLASAWVCRQGDQAVESDSPSQLAFPALAILLAAGCIVLGWVTGLRVIHAWWWVGRASDFASEQGATLGSQLSYSAWCMTYGAALLTAGFWRRMVRLRWAGLGLVGLTILKVFFVDMGTLSQGYRILSFFGLGALLLAISFAYQNDWLALRGRGADE